MSRPSRSTIIWSPAPIVGDNQLDMDIYSEILRAVNLTVAVHAQVYRQAHGRLTLSVMTVIEMVKGFQQVQRPQKIAP
jgi:tRNA(fMet)-specific endonuclease VapC